MKILLRFIALIIFYFFISCAPSRNVPPYYDESFVNRSPNITEASILEKKAREKASINENKQAVILFTKIIKNYKNYSHLYRVFSGRAISYHKLLKYEKAKNDYKKSIKIYPHYINAWVGLGLLYKHVRNLEKAKKIFLHCIKIMPDKKANFILMINRLKPFSKAFFGARGITYQYDFMGMNFYFKLHQSLKIKTTENPYMPYLITPRGRRNDKTIIYLITMNFSSLSRYRFLTFRQRAQKWANLEEALFQKMFRKKLKLKDIKEITIGQKKCAQTTLESEKNKYRITFFFRKSFGIMIILKATKTNFPSKLYYLNKVVSLINFK